MFGTNTRLATTLVVLVACGGDATGTDNGDSGERILFQHDADGEFDIYAMNPDGSDVVNLTNLSPRQMHPSWSPDRATIAYISHEKPSGVWLMDATGENARGILPDWGPHDGFPDWSPDGSTLAFSSSRLTNGRRILAVDTDGTNMRILVDVLGANFPSWSPDGNWIAFEDNAQIWVIKTDGTDLRAVTTPPDAADTSPAWSPDGQQIAFCRGVPDPSAGPGEFGRVFVIKADGTNPVQVSHTIDAGHD
jgi:Tol biopolymer transport system component